MEAQFNFNNRIMARDLVQCAERGVNAPKEKYGSRKEKINYARCQQKTSLKHDTLTMANCYPLHQWLQILLRLYSLLSGKYGNTMTVNACTSNEVNDRNV